MSMQEIEEDLETFCKPSHKKSRDLIIDDLKAREDLDNLNLNEWWDAFEVNEQQLEELEKLDKRLSIMKNELQQYAKTEIHERINVIRQVVEENLERIQQIKSPE